MRAIGGAHQQTADAQLEVLWVGEAVPAIDALERFGVLVTCSSADQCTQQVASRAPDMIVLCGLELARVDAIVNELREQSPGSTIPVITVLPGAARLDAPPRRAGVVARLGAELPANQLAAEIHECLTRLASSSWQHEVAIPWYELDAWVAGALKDKRSGLLVSSEPRLAIAFGASGHFAPGTGVLRAAFAQADTDEPRVMRFVELAPSRLHVLTRAQTERESADLADARITVVHPHAAQREAWCSALLDAGAEVHSVDLDPEELATVPAFAPTLLVLAASALNDERTSTLWEDARLASVSWLMVDDSSRAGITPLDLVGPAAALVATSRRLQRRLGDGEVIVDRIESFGAAGWLKEVGRSAQSLTLILLGSAGRGEISLAGGKIREATFAPSDAGSSQTGRAALQAALAMPFGKVLVGPHEAVLARETALPLERARRPQAAAADATDHEPSDFQERPTGAHTMTLKPGARRSLRPSRSSRPPARSKQSAGHGRVVQLKSPTLPAVTAPPPPPRVSAAPPVPSPVRVAQDTWPAPAMATRPIVIMPANEQGAVPANEQGAVPAVATAAAPQIASSLSEQIAADIEGVLAAASATDELYQVAAAPRRRSLGARGWILPGAVAIVLCVVTLLVVWPRSLQGAVVHAERWVDELRQSLDGPRKLAPVAAPVQAESADTPTPVLSPTPSAPEVQANANADTEPRVEQAPAPELRKAEQDAPREERSAPDDTQAGEPAEPVQAPSPASAAPTTEGTQAAEAVQVPSLDAPEGARPDEADEAAPPAEAPAPEEPGAGIEEAESASFDVLLARAKRARDRGRDEEAQALLARALDLEPDDFGARYHMALTLVRLRRFESALLELDKAVALDPASALPWLLRGDVFLQQGTMSKALAAWTRCLELRPELEACDERIRRWKGR